MASVVWSRLLLRGFGRYQSEVSIDLTDALSVLVGPNEVGKTTLVAGLTAVLFGLPVSQDPTKFGQARFRNWQSPPRFEGELFFSVEGEEYHLQRDFETNRVSLRLRGGAGWRELAQGTDNPNASRPNRTYRDLLRHLIGVRDGELFQDTFCLAQPLPAPEGLNEAVQGLLSGAGSRVGEVQTSLENQVKSLTRYYGEPLGHKGKGNKDRRLEQLEGSIRLLEQQISSGRSSADGLQAVQAQLTQTEATRAAELRQLATAERLLSAWTTWRSHRERYELQLGEQQQLQQSWDRAKELEQRLEQQRQSLLQYRDLQENDGQWEGLLEQLTNNQHARESLASELAQTERERNQQTSDRTLLLVKLQDLPPELTNPGLLADHARLQELQAQLLERTGALGRLAERQQNSQEQLSALPDFSLLGEQPVARLKEWRRLLTEQGKVYARWQEQQVVVTRLRAELQSGYHQMQQANPGALDELRDYRRRQLELGTRERDLQREYTLVAGQEEAFASADNYWRQQFGPLRQAPERLLDALNERIQALSGRQSRRQTKSAAGSVWPWLVGLAAAALAYGLWGRQAGTLGISVSLLLGAVMGIASKFLTGAKMSPENPDRGTADLGPLASLALPELITAHTLLERLARAQAERPGAGLNIAKNAWEQSREELVSWQRRLQPFIISFTDPQATYEQWQALRQQLQLAERDLAAVAADLSFDPASQAAAAQLTEHLGLSPLWQLLPRQTDTVEGLLQEYGPDSPVWPAWLDQAGRWESLQLGRKLLSSQEEQLNRRSQSGEDEVARLQEAISGLERQVGTLVAWQGTELSASYGQFQDLRANLTTVESHLQRAEQQLCEQQLRQAELNQVWQALMTKVATSWQIAGNLDALKQRFAEYQSLQLAASQTAAAQNELFTARQVASLAELQRQSLSLGNTIAAVQMRWQELIDQHPGLPAIRETADPERIQELSQATEARVEQLRQATDQSRQQVEQLLRQQASLEGQEPCNVAAAEEALSDLRAERDRLQREVAALGLAFRELSQAKLDYEHTYRERLASQASGYFDRITGGQGRSVELGTDLRVTVLTSEGKSVLPAQLSQGARDQLYFSLRLAIADLLADQTKLPFILDDPFVNSDQERLERIREALTVAAGERQIWLFTHQEQLADWGVAVQINYEQ